MNRLKLLTGVILIFLVGILAGAIISGFYFKNRINDFAGDDPPESARVRMLLDRFSRDLKLTDAQKIEIEKILRDVQDEILKLRRQTFPEIEELNEKGLEKINAVLNSEQRGKFNGFQNRMKRVYDRYAVRLDFPVKSTDPNIDEMKDFLKLTSEQAAEIKKVMDEGIREREQIMEETRKADHPDFSEIRQKMMESKEMQRKTIEDILTDEQVKDYRQYINERRPDDRPGSRPDRSRVQPRPPRW